MSCPEAPVSVSVLSEELRQYDSFEQNHTYVEEQAFFSYIRNGDTEYLKKNHEKIDLPHPMIIPDPVKNEEYMAVIGISMAARCAIEGGVTSQDALLINDVFLKRLSECRGVKEIHSLVKEAYLYFADSVRQCRQGRAGNRYIEECKQDIHSRKREKISLQTIADDVGISKEYMMKLFKKHEGIAITDYIIQVKIEAACNMLKFSDRQISEIADYLSFGSANYFSRIFRKRMGMPPGQYREVYHQPNF